MFSSTSIYWLVSFLILPIPSWSSFSSRLPWCFACYLATLWQWSPRAMLEVEYPPSWNQPRRYKTDTAQHASHITHQILRKWYMYQPPNSRINCYTLIWLIRIWWVRIFCVPLAYAPHSTNWPTHLPTNLGHVDVWCMPCQHSHEVVKPRLLRSASYFREHSLMHHGAMH